MRRRDGLVRKDNYFRRFGGKQVIERILSGSTVSEAVESEGHHMRVMTYRTAQAYAEFDAALQAARFAARIAPLAEELDSAELRDLQGFAAQVSKRLVEEWSNGRTTQ